MNSDTLVGCSLESSSVQSLAVIPSHTSLVWLKQGLGMEPEDLFAAESTGLHISLRGIRATYAH